MSLLFDSDELRNFRDKVPSEDFSELKDPIERAMNLAGEMDESKKAQWIHLGLLRKLEIFATEVPQGLDALRYFAVRMIEDYEGVDGDNKARQDAINKSFLNFEATPEPAPAGIFPHLPEAGPAPTK